MKTIEVKRQLLEEALDQLKRAQQDCYVLSTQNVIDELELALRQPDVSGSLPSRAEIEKASLEYWRKNHYPKGESWGEKEFIAGAEWALGNDR